MITFAIEKYFLYLTLYSMIGWIYETTLCSITQKHFVNRGFLNGPYCPIYGFGAVIVIIILCKVNNIFILFILSTFFTCLLEYLTSWVMEKLFHARWWDYSDKTFNLNGRICLEGAIVFGTLSTLLIKYLHPIIIELIDKFPLWLLHSLSLSLFIILVTDTIITIRGLKIFNKTLNNITEQMKNNEIYLSVSGFLAEHIKKTKWQEKRILLAFPKLHSLKYNDALNEIRKFIKHKK